MSAHSYRETLKHRGLQPFLWTQFLGAFNDNFFKFVVTMVAVHTAVNEAASGRNVSLVGIVFVAPFLLFSGYAGQLADAFSKRTVLVVTKSLEIVATGLSLVAFASGRLELLYAVLLLIAVQATFFSPAKYGLLPEMLPARERRARDEHVRRDRGGRRRGDRGLRGVARPALVGRRHGRGDCARRLRRELRHSPRAGGRACHAHPHQPLGRHRARREGSAARSRAAADGARPVLLLVPRR